MVNQPGNVAITLRRFIIPWFNTAPALFGLLPVVTTHTRSYNRTMVLYLAFWTRYAFNAAFVLPPRLPFPHSYLRKHTAATTCGRDFLRSAADAWQNAPRFLDAYLPGCHGLADLADNIACACHSCSSACRS